MTSADHPWDLAPADARALQNRLRSRVIVHDQLADELLSSEEREVPVSGGTHGS